MSNRRRRLMAGLVSCVYFTTQVVLASAPETGFWVERRRHTLSPKATPRVPSPTRAPRLSLDRRPPTFASSANRPGPLPRDFIFRHAALLRALPPDSGSLEGIFLPPRGAAARVVVHIQDVHGNADAQKNIARTVQSLIDHNAVGLVALEGASTAIDLSGFRSFPDRGTVRRVADYLLRENRISGPIHTAFTAGRETPPFIGVEDPVHHAANVEAYRAAAPLIATGKRALASRRAEMEERKTAVFNPALLRFDRRVQAHRRGAMSPRDYVKTLAAAVPRLTPAVSDFLKTLEAESALDWDAVERERAQLGNRLIHSLDKDQIEDLRRCGAAFRRGEIRPANFYQDLGALCHKGGVPLSRFPALDAYRRYVLRAEGLSSESLFKGMEETEARAYARLAKTPEEKALVKKSRRLFLTEKLVDFSLTPGEWAAYAARPTGAGLPGVDLTPFEAFYREAGIRDAALADNTLTAMRDRPSPAAVLVTGGYHAPGVRARLLRAGVAVITFRPKIEQAATAEGPTALSVFTREKTPLEKLFQGEKLFLAADPCPRFELFYMGVALLRQEFLAGGGRLRPGIQDRLKALAPGAMALLPRLRREDDGLLLTTPAGLTGRLEENDGELVFKPLPAFSLLRERMKTGVRRLWAMMTAPQGEGPAGGDARSPGTARRNPPSPPETYEITADVLMLLEDAKNSMERQEDAALNEKLAEELGKMEELAPPLLDTLVNWIKKTEGDRLSHLVAGIEKAEKVPPAVLDAMANRLALTQDPYACRWLAKGLIIGFGKTQAPQALSLFLKQMKEKKGWP